MSGQDKSQAANEQAHVTILDDSMPIFLGSLGGAVPLCSTYKNGYLTISNHS